MQPVHAWRIICRAGDGFSIKRTTAWERHDGVVDIAINGSYLAYVYVGLLQISIVYLQRPD
jgi:hypothetical protein